MDEFSENFRRLGVGWVISDLKNFIANLFALETVILVMNFWKNFKKAKRGGTWDEKVILTKKNVPCLAF